MRGWASIFTTSLLALSSASNADITEGRLNKFADTGAQKADESLGEKLLKLSQSLDMQTAKYPESGQNGGTDRNSGNPSYSNTTLHTYVDSVCLEWADPTQLQCNKWLDPYVPLHGLQGGDSSPLEDLVAQQWQQKAGVDGNGQYRIWNIQRVDGAATNTAGDGSGKLDLSGVVDWRLMDDVKGEVAEVGRKTAVKAMLTTYDKSSGSGKNTLPNLEALRVMASRFTRMFRNRLVSNLGEMRAASAPSEFLLGEELPNCEAYRAVVAAKRSPTVFDEKLDMQARLQPETVGTSLDDRYNMCVKLRQASVKSINPTVAGGKVQNGDVESERVDQVLTRLNIAAIDKAGVDVQALPRPSNVSLTEDQVKSEFADWNVGGQTVREIKRETNARTLKEFNQNLEIAAVGYEGAALRSGAIKDKSAQVRGFKIEPGTKSAIEINAMTPSMRRELASTSFADSGVMKAAEGKGPEKELEDSPAELVVTPSSR